VIDACAPGACCRVMIGGKGDDAYFVDNCFDATARDNAVAFFQISEHLLHVPALFLLWPKDHEVKRATRRAGKPKGACEKR